MENTSATKLILVEDDRAMNRLLAAALRQAAFDVRTFTNPLDALVAHEQKPAELVVSDVNMPEMNGVELLQSIRQITPDLPIILLSGNATVTIAVEAMKVGAFDFLTKPVATAHLLEVVKRALSFARLEAENHTLKQRLRDLVSQEDAGELSDPMQRLHTQAKAVAATDATVLITGESGVGKEVLADLIQRHSPRANRPYIKVNCGAIPESILEAELFGHEKGAFTGAAGRRMGIFERANHGTVFLDEIGEMPMPAQTRLLRVLQERTITRLGGESELALDIRIICATNRPLAESVQAGTFREDLFYRINVFPLHIPPLRERPDDIPVLAARLLARIRSRMGRGPEAFSVAAQEKLRQYTWPGNVRELENVIERCAILRPAGEVDVEDLPDGIGQDPGFYTGSTTPLGIPGGFLASPLPRGYTGAPTPLPDGQFSDVQPGLTAEERIEKQHILQSLQDHHWKVTAVARSLGMSRSTLYVKMAKYAIKR